MKGNIWVINDGCDSYVPDYVQQMVSQAKRLSHFRGGRVEVFMFGSEIELETSLLSRCGADVIQNLCIHQNEFTREYITEFISGRIQIDKPDLIMIPNSEFGRFMASTLSIRFGAGLTADCFDIQCDAGGSFIYKRAAVGSSVIADIVTQNSAFDLCTVKKNVFHMEHWDEQKAVLNRYYQKLSEPAAEKNIESRVLYKKQMEHIDFSSYHIIFGVGRGIKTKKNVQLLQDAAGKFGAGVVGTRAAVEEGLIGESCQVGQSGASIAPGIYVAFGISGATQHMVGIKKAKTVIAVNHDPNAPVFEYADYAIVNDTELILKEMMRF